MLSLFADAAPASFGFGLLQFGIAGATFGGVLAIVVRPLIAASIAQNGRALDLLEKSVSSNTEAVDLFRRYETMNTARQERILDMQERVLDLLARVSPSQPQSQPAPRTPA